MQKGKDTAIQFPGVELIHQNLPGKEVGVHSHSENILFIPLLGEITVRIDGQVLRAGPGRMVFLPSQQAHSFDSSETDGERLIVMMKKKFWNQNVKKTYEPCTFISSQLMKELLFYLLLNPGTRHHKSLLTVFAQTLGEILENSDQILGATFGEHFLGKIRDPRIRKCVGYLKDHLSEVFSMSAAARVSGLSTRSLNRLFLQEVGTTPKKLLIYYRIEHAQELLVRGDRTVTEAAFEVGYSSLAQFIKAFRNQTGQLPSEVVRLGQKL